MPQLPDKFALGQMPGGGDRSLATIPTGRDAINTGDAVAALGKSVAGIAGEINAKVEKADDYEIQKSLIDFDLAQEKRLQDVKHNAPAGAEGITETYRSGYDADARALMERVPRRLRPKVDEILVRKGAGYEEKAYRFELEERDRYHVDDVRGKTEELLNDTTSAPERRESNRERIAALYAASKVPTRFKLKAMREALSANDEVAIRTELDRIQADDGLSPDEKMQRKIELRERVRQAPIAAWNRETTSTPGTIDFIKQQEGDKDSGWDYRQYSGPYGVKRGPNEKLSLEEAEKRLKEEVSKVESEMDAKIKVPLASSQRAALTSLFYNIGTGKGRLDQVADMINRGDVDKVPGWIKQFNRNADGGYMPGLADRRSREAELFARAEDEPAPAATKRGGVKVTELAPPGAEGGSTLPDTSDEPKPVDGKVAFEHLSVKARRTLGNIIGTSLRADVEKTANDDIERLRRGQPLPTDANGQTSIDRAAKYMTGHQAKVIADKATAARFEHETLSPIREQSDAEQLEWAAKTWPRAEEGKVPLKEAAAIEKKQQSRINQNQKLRKTDPAYAVSGYPVEDEDGVKEQPLPATRAAYSAIRAARAADTAVDATGKRVPIGGPKQGMTPQQEWDMIFEARLTDQAKIMPDAPYGHRIITRREAEQLLQMPKNGDGLDRNAYQTKLKDAADRAEQIYGKKWGKRVIEEAIAFQLHGGDEDQKNIKARITRQLATGETPDKADLRRLDALSQLDRLGRPSLATTTAPAGRFDLPAIAGAMPVPTPEQEDLLRRNPDSVGVFDQLFGKGAGARVLAGDGKTITNPGKPKDYAPEKRKGWFQ